MDGGGGSRAAQRRKKKKRKASKPLPVVSRKRPAVESESEDEPMAPAAGASASGAEQIQREIPAGGGHAICADRDLTSPERARLLLAWMLHPITVEEFHSEYWEKKPLIVRREDRHYFDGWLSLADIRKIVGGFSVEYGVDLDVTSYKSGKRRTHNGEGVVDADEVWRRFDSGCSVRLLCPQRLSDPVWKLLSALEDEFNCMVGSNAYLTPAGHQGFAPHYDDIEAFLLQLEGTKHWRVYRPPTPADDLARFSSPNYAADDPSLGQPVIEADLRAGDLLYFPRGWVHQAYSPQGSHSLHLTVSTYQNNSFADLAELVLPQALGKVCAEARELREGLPRDLMRHMGAAHSVGEDDDPVRQAVRARLREGLERVVEEAMEALDAGCDQLTRAYVHDRLPPPVAADEHAATAAGNPTPRISAATNVRMLRPGLAHMVIEDGQAVVYHAMDNARVRHGNPLPNMAFDIDLAPAIEAVLSAYPEAVQVGDLPAEDAEDRVALVQALYGDGWLLCDS